MKRSTVILIIIILAAALIGSCNKEQTTYDKQATYIENFVSARMKADTNATLTENGGAFRLTMADTLEKVLGKRDSLLEGGTVVLQYACYTLTSSTISNSNLVATNVREVAEKAGWYLSDTTRYKLDTLVLGKTLVEGLRLGLHGVQQYDNGYILFTGQYGFGNKERGTIPARSALVYQYYIASIQNE